MSRFRANFFAFSFFSFENLLINCICTLHLRLHFITSCDFFSWISWQFRKSISFRLICYLWARVTRYHWTMKNVPIYLVWQLKKNNRARFFSYFLRILIKLETITLKLVSFIYGLMRACVSFSDKSTIYEPIKCWITEMCAKNFQQYLKIANSHINYLLRVFVREWNGLNGRKWWLDWTGLEFVRFYGIRSIPISPMNHTMSQSQLPGQKDNGFPNMFDIIFNDLLGIRFWFIVSNNYAVCTDTMHSISS